jgi:hypothetical protein
MKKPWDPNRWTYSVDEVSNNMYEVVANDHQGTEIRRHAPDSDALLAAVKEEAAEITRRRREAADSP